MGGTKLQPKDKKCHNCEELGTNHFENKWYCWNHLCEAKKKSNKNYEQIQLLKKLGIVGVATIGVIAGLIVIYQFFSG